MMEGLDCLETRERSFAGRVLVANVLGSALS